MSILGEKAQRIISLCEEVRLFRRRRVLQGFGETWIFCSEVEIFSTFYERRWERKYLWSTPKQK